jgi:hypothetical protein
MHCLNGLAKTGPNECQDQIAGQAEKRQSVLKPHTRHQTQAHPYLPKLYYSTYSVDLAPVRATELSMTE